MGLFFGGGGVDSDLGNVSNLMGLYTAGGLYLEGTYKNIPRVLNIIASNVW